MKDAKTTEQPFASKRGKTIHIEHIKCFSSTRCNGNTGFIRVLGVHITRDILAKFPHELHAVAGAIQQAATGHLQRVLE